MVQIGQGNNYMTASGTDQYCGEKFDISDYDGILFFKIFEIILIYMNIISTSCVCNFACQPLHIIDFSNIFYQNPMVWYCTLP